MASQALQSIWQSASQNKSIAQAMQNIWHTASQNKNATLTLAALGGVWAALKAYDVAAFTHLHFLRSSSLGRYQRYAADGTQTAWALVTGASDGIGVGFAEELCHRGFNVILHGRNKEKLNKIRADLERKWPKAQFRLLLIDAVLDINDEAKIAAAVGEISNLEITLLINNAAGGQSPWWQPLGESSSSRVRYWIDANVTFTTEITRLLIPILAKSQPGLIMTIGSYAGTL